MRETSFGKIDAVSDGELFILFCCDQSFKNFDMSSS